MTLGKGKSIWYLRYKEKTNTNKSWKNDTAKYTVLGRPQPITWQQNDAQNHAGTGSGDQIPIRDFRLYILHGTWKDGSDERRRRRTSTPVRADRKGNRITSLYNRAEQKSISSWMSYDRGRSYRVPVQESSKRSLRLQGAQTHPDSFRLENGKWPGEDASPLTTVVESAYWGSCSPVITNHLPWDTRSSRSRTSQRGD